MRSRRFLAVVGVAVVLAVGGTTAATLAARSVARNNATAARQSFEGSSATVAASLQLAIRREEDLAVDAAGFFLASPTAGDTEFAAWSSSVQAMQRYPELLGWAQVVIVPAIGLDAFIADTVSSARASTFEILPSGVRQHYCLARVAQNRDGAVGAPPGFDYCAPTAATDPFAAIDGGTTTYEVIDVGTGDTLAVSVPFYEGGVVPPTVQARRAAFVGWVGMGFDPGIVMRDALELSPVRSVELSFDDGTSEMTFETGARVEGTATFVTELDNGWTVRTYDRVRSASISGDAAAIWMLLTGLLLAWSLSLLVLVLGTSRARAMRLVDQRTGELRHQALHDALTGLPNRALIMDRIDQLLAHARRHGAPGAALYIDLDDFKNVNDTLGHQAGDRLLVAVAQRLTSTLRDADTIGRMGGDEFVVLIDALQLDAAPELVAERLLDVMRQPFLLAGTTTPLMINASIGIAVGDRATAEDLVHDADVALYEAKAAGKNRYEIFLPAMQSEISRRIELEFDLRSAIVNNELRLVYQPIYNLEDLTIVGTEALLRWDHPTLGAVEPDEFIPILEQTGQINEIGRWVLLEACKQMAIWHGRGDTLELSVNVSARQLDHDAIIDDIRNALAISGLDATSLIIEVTETALMRNATAAAARLRSIRDLGIRIAVDDFGTGYSSLAYLQQFPVDCLKIDRRFTNAIATSPESRALIGTLVQLGKDLGLKTLAEGVETTIEIDHLRKERVTEAQGFLLSRPLDPEALEAQLLSPTRVQDGNRNGIEGPQVR